MRRILETLAIIIGTLIICCLLACAPMSAYALEPGQQYCRDAVCVNKAQLMAMSTALYNTELRAKYENATQLLAEKRQLREALRENLTDADLFVMWNNAAAREYIQQATPKAWAVMSDLMIDLARQHKYEPGRTYTLDY